MQTKPQAEVIEIDAEDAPYLDLQDDREWQGYAILKNKSFVHTQAFDPDLLIKTGMCEDFSNVWHEIGWDNFVPVEEYGSRLLTIQFFCSLREMENGGILSTFREGVSSFFGKLLLATSISTSVGQFHLNKLATVLIVMNFGVKF